MKKGKVKKAKLLTYLMSLLVLVSSYFIYQYFNDIVTPTGSETEMVLRMHYVFVYAMTICTTLMIWTFGNFIIWIGPTTYKMKNNAKRFAYHHDRIMKAFSDKDYDKVKNTYDNRFKNDTEHEHFANKIKFAYEVVTKK